MNKVILCGNLGRDAEIKHFANGAVTNLLVVTKESWVDKQGQRQEKSEWHNVSCWNKLADKCADLKKGTRVFVEGSIETQQYEKNGEKRYVTKIKATHVEFGVNDLRPLKNEVQVTSKNLMDDAKAMFNAEFTTDSIPF